MPIRVGMVSLGCSKNLVDSERMLAKLRAHGYQLVTEPGEAEIAIVNTCGFIQSAKEEAIETILELGALKKDGTLKKIMWCDDDAIKPYFIAAGKALTYGSMRRQMADSLEDKPFPALPEDLQCRCWFEFGSAEDHLKYRAGNAGYSDVRSQEVFRAVSEPVPGRDRNRA